MGSDSTIFISIPSIEDSELIHTINNAINSAKFPERIYIGVAYSSELNNFMIQNKLKEKFKKNKNINFIFLNWKKNYGISYGRLAAASLYNNQDYFLQIDAHTLFDQEWDQKLINIYHDAQKKIGRRKIVITGYPAHYHYDNRGRRVLLDEEWKLLTIKFNGGSYVDRIFSNPDSAPEDHFGRLIPNWIDIDPKELWNDYEREYLYSVKLSGGLIFGGKDFAEDYKNMYPYNYSFYEEEVLSSLELFDLGYTFVCPSINVPVAHLYSSHINQFGGERKFYEMSENDENKYKEKYIAYINKNVEKIKRYESSIGVNLLTNTVTGDPAKPRCFDY